MSIPTILHVFNHSKAKKSHRLVLLEIANHVNDDNGLAWPSYRTLVSKTGLSRRRVIDIVADLKALGELEVLPTGSPTGGQAYRIKGGAAIAPPPQKGGAKNDTRGVQPLHPESYIEESIFRKKSGGEGNGEEEAEQRPLTRLEALRLGLTPGSKFFRFITGQSDE